MDALREFFMELSSGVQPGYQLTLSDAYDEYKRWYRDNFPGRPIVDRSTFKIFMINRFVVSNDNTWSISDQRHDYGQADM